MGRKQPVAARDAALDGGASAAEPAPAENSGVGLADPYVPVVRQPGHSPLRGFVPARWERAYHTFLVVLAFFALVRGALVMAITPPWQGPDEPGHFEYVALIYRLGRIPKALPETETVSDLTLAINASARAQRFEHFHPGINLQKHSEQNPPLLVGPREAGYQRPTYYLLLLPIYWLVRSQDILIQYYALALTSVLLGLVTIWAAAMAARALLPNIRWAQIAVPLLVAFWPTQMFLSTRINNDNLATAVGALTFWLVAELIRHGPRPVPSIGLLTLLALAAYTKGTVLFLLPLGAIALVLGLSQRFPVRWRWRVEWSLAAIVLLGLVLVLLAVLAPPVAVWLRTLVPAIPGDSQSEAWIVLTLDALASGVHWQPDRLLANQTEALHILRTFWAVFGWGRFFLPPPWYGLAAVVGSLALVGWLRPLLPTGRQALGWLRWQWQVLAVYIVGIALACVPLIARMLYQPFTTAWHGRILLPTLVPVSVLVVLGLYQWIPPRWRASSLLWLAALLLLLDAASFASVILPRFYQ